MNERLQDELASVEICDTFVLSEPAKVAEVWVTFPPLLKTKCCNYDLLGRRRVSLVVTGEQAVRVPNAGMRLMPLRLEGAADKIYRRIEAALEIAEAAVEELARAAVKFREAHAAILPLRRIH